MGEAFTRHFLRPLLVSGAACRKDLGVMRRGTADVHLMFEFVDANENSQLVIPGRPQGEPGNDLALRNIATWIPGSLARATAPE
jgi:hypothetical protein